MDSSTADYVISLGIVVLAVVFLIYCWGAGCE